VETGWRRASGGLAGSRLDGVDVASAGRDRSGWSVGRPALWTLGTVASLLPVTPRTAALAGLVVAGGVAMVIADRVASPALRLVLVTFTVASGLVTTVLVPQALGPIPVLVAASVAPRLLPRRVAVGLVAVSAVAFAATVAWASGSVYGSLAGIAVPLLAARSFDRVALRAERDRATALLAELEERRAADLHAAATEERARIAREMHDVLAHTLSGLSLHLQAARALAAGDARTGPTLTATIDRAADLARSGLDEAREAVASLRTDGPAPGRGALEALVATHPRAALEVDGAFDALAGPLRATVFATVREALTNAGRHAPGAAVTVRVAPHGPGGVEVRVHDDGPATTPRAEDRGGGQGLAGLAERASGVGGHLEASPDGAGWTVTLRVPGEGP
jgi:signal transduction histidine kinase